MTVALPHVLAAAAGATVCLTFIGVLGISVAYAAKAQPPSPTPHREKTPC